MDLKNDLRLEVPEDLTHLDHGYLHQVSCASLDDGVDGCTFGELLQGDILGIDVLEISSSVEDGLDVAILFGRTDTFLLEVDKPLEGGLELVDEKLCFLRVDAKLVGQTE